MHSSGISGPFPGARTRAPSLTQLRPCPTCAAEVPQVDQLVAWHGNVRRGGRAQHRYAQQAHRGAPLEGCAIRITVSSFGSDFVLIMTSTVLVRVHTSTQYGYTVRSARFRTVYFTSIVYEYTVRYSARLRTVLKMETVLVQVRVLVTQYIRIHTCYFRRQASTWAAQESGPSAFGQRSSSRDATRSSSSKPSMPCSQNYNLLSPPVLEFTPLSSKPTPLRLSCESWICDY